MERCRVCLETSERVVLKRRELSQFYSICAVPSEQDFKLELVCPYCWRRIVQCLRFIESAKRALCKVSSNPLLSYETEELHPYKINSYRYTVNCKEEICQSSCISESVFKIEVIPIEYDFEEIEVDSEDDKRNDDPFDPYLELINNLNDNTVKEENIVIKAENDLEDEILQDATDEIEYTPIKIKKLSKPKSKHGNKIKNRAKHKNKDKIKYSRRDKSSNNDFDLEEKDEIKDSRKNLSERDKAKSLGLVFVKYTTEEQIREIELKKQRRRYKYAKFKCEKCGLGYQTKSVYEQHYNYKHSEAAGSHVCHVCGYRYHNASLLSQHVSDAHERKWRCVRCTEDIIRQDWVQHQNKCVPEGAKTQCDVCGKSFKSKKGMHRHKMQVHGPKQTKNFECDICNKRYLLKSQLINHMRTHTGEKPYECAPCGKKFMTMAYLRIHLDGVHRTHEPPEERYCVECDRHFKSKRLLHAHLESTKLHAKVDQFKHECTVCHKKFIHAIRLTEHMKSIHLKVKEFTCNECGKTFSTKGPLAKHLVTKHSQTARARNNICPICGAAFMAKATVRQHILAIHEKQRPHVCNICGATFGFSGAMYTHVQLKHKGVKRSRPSDPSTSKLLSY